MLALLIPGLHMGGGEAVVLVEIPDVVGETQAAGTTTLETALFVVAVETAYSASVALGLIISQVPGGGEFAASGSTVTITVSLGPESSAPRRRSYMVRKVEREPVIHSIDRSHLIRRKDRH